MPIVGLSLVVSGLRAIQVYFWYGTTGGVAIALETCTGFVRIVLFVVMYRLALKSDPRIEALSGEQAFQRARAFVREQPLSLAAHAVLFSGSCGSSTIRAAWA